MQIVITCDSYDELIAAAKQILDGKVPTETVTNERDVITTDPVKPAKNDTSVKVMKKAKPEPEYPEPKFVDDPEPAPTATEIINKVEAKIEADESDVKVLLADKIKKGKKAEVRALFEEYGVTKLSELVAKCPDKLPELAQKAEAL